MGRGRGWEETSYSVAWRGSGVQSSINLFAGAVAGDKGDPPDPLEFDHKPGVGVA